MPSPRPPMSSVVVKPASKDTASKMDEARTKEGLKRQENARINKAAQRLLEKTGVAVVDQSRAGARTSAGISGAGGAKVAKVYKPMGGGGGMLGSIKNR